MPRILPPREEALTLILAYALLRLATNVLQLAEFFDTPVEHHGTDVVKSLCHGRSTALSISRPLNFIKPLYSSSTAC